MNLKCNYRHSDAIRARVCTKNVFNSIHIRAKDAFDFPLYINSWLPEPHLLPIIIPYRASFFRIHTNMCPMHTPLHFPLLCELFSISTFRLIKGIWSRLFGGRPSVYRHETAVPTHKPSFTIICACLMASTSIFFYFVSRKLATIFRRYWHDKKMSLSCFRK